jgi:hypothetical protein
LADEVTTYVVPPFWVPLPMIGSHVSLRTTGFAAGAAAGAAAEGVVTAGVDGAVSAAGAGAAGVVAGVVAAAVELLSSSPPLAISTITTTTAARTPPMATQRAGEPRRRPGFRLGSVAVALAATAVRGGALISGTAAAAARARAFDPDFGAVLRAVLAGALELEDEAVRLAGALRVEAEEARLAGALRVFPVDFDVFPVDFDAEAELLRVAGFFLPALELIERDFERLLGFLGVAIPTHY